MSSEATASKDGRSGLERLLGIFTDVKRGEGLSAVLMTLNVFLLLTSYYIVKPVRDALITSMPGGRGDVYKSYMGGAIAVALLFAVPAYASFAKKLPRNRLVVGATLFFVLHLVLFALALQLPGNETWLPLLFFLWVGIFNMMVVAQFWAFANDIYDENQGKRLFALIGIGASAGAAAGGALAKWLPIQPAAALEGGCSAVTKQVGYFGSTQMLLLSGAILGACALLTQIVHARESKAASAEVRSQLKNTVARVSVDEVKKAIDEARKGGTLGKTAPTRAKPRPGAGAFALVARYRYLTLMAAFSLVFTLVNTNGEYMISKLVKEMVFSTVNQCAFADESVKKAFIKGMFTSWYGDFYLYVNVAGVLLQSFAVSRIVKWGGIRLALFVFPAMALLGASAVLLFPVLAVLRAAKIAENSSDYSVNNTARNMLWLPTTTAMKYQAKQAVDTFFVRMGDVSSALLVFVFADLLGLTDVRLFAGANVLLVALLLWVTGSIIREQASIKKMRETGALSDEAPSAAE